MPNIDASIPLSGKDPFSSLSGMVGTMQGLQNLQTGAIQQQRQQTQLTQEQAAMDAQRAMSGILADPEMRLPDGTMDLNKFTQKAFQANPNNPAWGKVASDMLSSLAQSNKSVVELKNASVGLGEVGLQYVGHAAGALSLDPTLTKDKVLNILDSVKNVVPNSAAGPFIDVVNRMIGPLEDKPEILAKALKDFRDRTFPLAAQQPQTTFVQSGTQAVPAQSNALAGPVGPMAGATPVQTGLVPPSQAQNVKTDLLDNPYIEEKTPDGRIVNKPINANADAPMLEFPKGESKQSAELQRTLRTSVNQAAAAVPEQHFNNQQIIRLAKGTTTGEGAQIIANLKGAAAGLPWTSDEASNFNQLGHFLALQSNATAKQMGISTDFGRAGAEQAAGSTKWTGPAIERSAKINDALSTGLEYFNRGVEAAIKSPDNKIGPFALRDFQNTWAKNFDVNAARLLNASEHGDKKEISEIVTGLGGPNSVAAKELAKKAEILHKLSTEGHL